MSLLTGAHHSPTAPDMKDSGLKTCACKGIRTCLLCEANKRSVEPEVADTYADYYFCRECGDNAFDHRFTDHSTHTELDPDSYINIDGVFVEPDIVTISQEAELIRRIDSFQWVDSQSGRRKQDFGPRVNFKKQKVNIDRFVGLPLFDKDLLESVTNKLKNRNCAVLDNFTAVEVCHLEYDPSRGSAIDLHFDDFWVWGQRLVTINLMSDTVLNLVLPEESRALRQSTHRVRIPLTARSLVVLWSDARYKYQHSIEREDINSRRIAITYREFSEEFLPNGTLYESIGKKLIDISMQTI